MVHITGLDDDDYEKLKRLDEVSELINAMKNEDLTPEELKKYEGEADKVIKQMDNEKTKTVINKTRINTTTSKSSAQKLDLNSGIFSSMAADADERYRRKQENIKKATKLKEKANQLLKDENLEGAEALYSECLDLVPDMKIFYTNRAICRIKRKKFDDAIKDCEWALKLDEKCPKAITQIGHAHRDKGNFEEAAKWYCKLLSLDKRELMVSYLTRLEFIKREAVYEREVHAHESEHDKFKKILKFTAKPREQPLYYEASLLLLEEALLDKPEFSIIVDNSEFHNLLIESTEAYISKLWTRQLVRSNSTVEISIIMCLWRIIKLITAHNHHCGEELIGHSSFSRILMAALKNEVTVRSACLEYLYYVSTNEIFTLRLRSSFVKEPTFAELLLILSESDGEYLPIQIIANFSKRKLWIPAENMLYTMGKVLHNFDVQTPELFYTVLTAYKKISKNTENSSKLSSCQTLWENVLFGLPKVSKEMNNMIYANSITALLEFLHFVTNQKSKILDEYSEKILKALIPLFKSKNMNIYTVLIQVSGNLAQKSTKCSELLEDLTEEFIQNTQNTSPAIQRLSARCLATVTELVKSSRSRVVKTDPSLSMVVKLFDQESEVTHGHAALIISNCISEIEPEDFDADAISRLINVVDLAKNDVTRKNAAIALSKAAKLSDQCRQSFRRNHGLEVLQSRMSQIKLS